MSSLLVGTADGLVILLDRTRDVVLGGQEVTGLDGRDGEWWSITGGRSLLRGDGRDWREVATVDGAAGTCLTASSSGVLVGTLEAHLWRLDGEQLTIVDGFERVDGRDQWYTPWGAPADARSLCESSDGIFVNVHVGGILRSTDGGVSWRPTIDVHADVHQVIRGHVAGQVLAATAQGLAISDDAGASWRFHTEGLPATYLRAVAICGGNILVSASSGPGGHNSGVYRTPVDADRPFEHCGGGLPADFGKNIDTHCLVASGPLAAVGTGDGAVYRSTDGSATWEQVAGDLPAITCLAIAPGQ